MYYFWDEIIKKEYPTRKEILRQAYKNCISIPAGAIITIREKGKRGKIATVTTGKLNGRKCVIYDNGSSLSQLNPDGSIGKKVTMIKNKLFFSIYEYK